jgi:hypothetical protein
MALMTENELKDLWVTESATEIPATQITECRDTSIAIIAERVDEQYMEALEADTENAETASKNLRRAQSKLFYRELLLFRSNRFRNGGQVKTERDENNSVTNSYEPAKDTELVRQTLWNEVMDILSPYLTEEAEEEVQNQSPRSTCKAINFGW